MGPAGTPALATCECAGSTGPAATSVGGCFAGCRVEPVCFHVQPYLVSRLEVDQQGAGAPFNCSVFPNELVLSL